MTSFYVLHEIMGEAYQLGLTGTAEPHRAFIGFQLNAKIRRRNYVRQSEMFFNPYSYPARASMYRAMKGARNLLIISAAEPVNNDRYERFRKKLVWRTENEGPFKNPSVFDVRSVSIIHDLAALYSSTV